ncbi:MAG: GNAT family N-acetyltransferase [Actinomycetota bacterium]
MRLQRATAADSKGVFAWANDPVTRANSASTDPIPWESHSEWFAAKLADPNCSIFIVSDGDEPVGVVRFDVAGDEAEISVNLAPEARGRGIGSLAIRVACAEVPDETVVAYIREENTASQKAFAAAGFTPDGRRVVRGVDMLRFVNAP